MRSDTESAPIAFAQQFLLLGGAAVEENGSSIEALIPENLRTMLHVPEHIRIFGDYGSTAGRSGQYVVSYGTPLLENMIREALEKVPLAACRLDFDYVKSGGFQRLLKEQVTFYGAVASIEAIAEVIKDYFLVAFRYSARSDEQKEGLLTAAFQADTGDFVPDMAEALDGAACGRAYFTPPESAPESLAGLATSVERTARRILRDQLEPFRQTMDRRLKRDIANLSEYYRSLDQEMRKSLEKPGLSENAQSDRQSKIDAIPSELASKTDDLLKKYSIKVGLQPAAVMQVRTPAKKIACSMAVGRRNRQFFLTYNPVTRCIDPPACSSCGRIISHIHFNGELKPVCFECK